MTTHPAEIGGSAIDKCDPYALTERIQYLVRHEMPFTEYEELLEELLRRQPGYDWSAYENFTALLREYRQALDAASVKSEEKRDEVVAFSGHRHAVEGGS